MRNILHFKLFPFLIWSEQIVNAPSNKCARSVQINVYAPQFFSLKCFRKLISIWRLLLRAKIFFWKNEKKIHGNVIEWNLRPPVSIQTIPNNIISDICANWKISRTWNAIPAIRCLMFTCFFSSLSIRACLFHVLFHLILPFGQLHAFSALFFTRSISFLYLVYSNIVQSKSTK